MLLRFRFDRDLDPRSVSRATVLLGSGNTTVLLTVRYDVVRRAIEAEPFRRGLLAAQVRYFAKLDGVRSLDGSALPEPVLIRFTTGTRTDDPTRDPAVGWDTIGPLLSDRCASRSGCHGGSEPAMGMRLDDAASVRSSVVGVPALEAPGPRSDEAAVGTFYGRPGLLRVDVVGGVGRPEYSYLLLKTTDHPWIIGEAMPRGEGPLDEASALLVQSWIRSGAPTSTTP